MFSLQTSICSTFVKFKLKAVIHNKTEKFLHYNVVLDIHSTKSSFITFNFTVFINIRMNNY